MQEIQEKYNLIQMQQIHRGWSSDRKYCAIRADGKKYFLRISNIEQLKQKRAEFEVMQKIAALGIPMCRPIDFGTSAEGVYSLQAWVEGKDAGEIIPLLSDTEQYVYGLQAGRFLRTIHTLPAPEAQEEWAPRFNRKINRNIQRYKECSVHFKGDAAFLRCIEDNRPLLENRPQSLQHGDYHIGNMMLEDGKLKIIDFNRFDYGDPWEGFNRIVWCAQKSPLFASGLVNGYFDNEPPEEFWKLLALYISSNTLSSLPWALPFGQQEIDTMLKQAEMVLDWYEGMTIFIPKWYTKGYYIQWIDGIPYKLKEPFDMSFVHSYGKVFKVYDDQDSGNICFGVQKDDKKYFLKFAGAPTEQYTSTPEEAIGRLKSTVPVYEELSHPNLIKFIQAEEVGGGFALLFEWSDAECMGRMYPLSRQKFLQMPIETKLSVFADILNFHAYVAERGWVAVDFYDGSILYDFARQKTMVCDIDFYKKSPYTNAVGRMYGSSLFMSPEEFEQGAVIDEITNVYLMGATVFALFGNFKRTEDKWMLNKAAYVVALKAVSDERGLRQQSIRQFQEEWTAALDESPDKARS